MLTCDGNCQNLIVKNLNSQVLRFPKKESYLDSEETYQ